MNIEQTSYSVPFENKSRQNDSREFSYAYFSTLRLISNPDQQIRVFIFFYTCIYYIYDSDMY